MKGIMFKGSSSTYALVKINKENFIGHPQNKVLDAILQDGINGTCFFISSNLFICAYHVFQKDVNNDSYTFLINEDQVHDKVHVLKEFKDLDLVIGISETPSKHFLSINSEELSINEIVFSLGYEKVKTVGAKIQLVLKKGLPRLLSLDIKSQVEVSNIIQPYYCIDRLSSSDGSILLKGCPVIIVDKPIPVGFSGGPLLTKEGVFLGLLSQRVNINGSEKENGSLIVRVTQDLLNDIL